MVSRLLVDVVSQKKDAQSLLQKSVLGSNSSSGSVSSNLQVSRLYVSVQATPVSPE